MPKPQLSTVMRRQGNNSALLDGVIAPDGYDLNFVDMPVLVQGFRRMVRALEFDVCEMAITTYLCAREHGVEFTALPVFLVRDFHHKAILVNTGAGISRPSDLEGTKVGVNRGYTVTTGVWARAALEEEGGVDLDKVTWLPSGDEHVAAYRPPSNVAPMPAGTSMEDLLVNGKLAATVGADFDHPDVTPLFPSGAGLRAFRERRLYPINHLVVVKNDVLKRHPDLAATLFNTFRASKDLYVEKLRAGQIVSPTAADRLHLQIIADTGDDPLPYGVEANRETLETLVRHAVRQRILQAPVPIDSIFADSTLSL